MQNPKEVWRSFRCFSIHHFSIFLEIPQNQISRGHFKSYHKECARGVFIRDLDLPYNRKLSPWVWNLGPAEMFHWIITSVCIFTTYFDFAGADIESEPMYILVPRVFISGLLFYPSPDILWLNAFCTQGKPLHHRMWWLTINTLFSESTVQ